MEHEAKSKKSEQEWMGIDGHLCMRSSDNGGIDRLPDDVLINIVSHMSLKEAARTSVLVRRWRYLWRFFHGTLRFTGIGGGNAMEREKFESWVNSVLDLHQGRYIEGMIISFEAWEIEGRAYAFPNLGMLKSHSHSHSHGAPFCRLRTLRLAHVDLKDEDVDYFLVSCPNLEELCIEFSDSLEKLRVVDPPSLRVLEISRCHLIQSLEISAEKLVSLKYGGDKNTLVLKKVPNLRKLTIRDDLCFSIFLEPKEHSSYSVQLEKLVLDFRLLKSFILEPIVGPPDLPQLCSLKRLEVQVYTEPGRCLGFSSLVKASPHLREFKIELNYTVNSKRQPTFPGIISKAGKFVHRNLKMVEMAGYIGCHRSEGLLMALIMRCLSIERVVIDIATDFFDHPQLYSYIPLQGNRATTRSKAKKCAQRFVSNMHNTNRNIEFMIVT